MAKILIVEDDQALAKTTSIHLRGEGHEVELAYDLRTARLHLKELSPDLIISDLHIGEENGLDLLAEARNEPQQPDVIFITGHAAASTAAQAMRDGAYEYVTKPFSMDEIGALAKRISERRLLIAENRKLRDELHKPTTGAGADAEKGLIVASASMRDLLDRVAKVARLQTTVLIRGESGTGKEVVARYVHARSRQPRSPFVAINCGAIPENLLASELFGHERGAYTGASARRAGAFERAHGGILFLDEMGEISQPTQVALLRVLETGEVTRVGGEKPFQVTVRLIAATHQDLEQRVKDGKFREDLYYRINVFTARIPPLRERKEDILPLARHFLTGFGMEEMPADTALAPLLDYPWPGNVRELRNVMENLFISCLDQPCDPALVRANLPRKPLQSGGGGGGGGGGGEETLEASEARQILDALRECGNNKTKAAEKLGITRRRLYSRMNVLGIDPDGDGAQGT